MATPTPPAAEAQVKPPDERFWVKYSPHHELPISSLASVAWHVFGLVLIVLVAFVVSYARNDDMPIETVGLAGGGGGNPLGVGQAPGSGSTSGLVDATKPRDQLKEPRPLEKTNADDPLTVTATDIFAGLTDDPEAQRQIAKIAERGTDALDRLNKLDKNLRDAIAAGKGKGGPGEGGGLGKGVGAGDGDGSGIGKLSQSAKRSLKWTISFSTSGGLDYLRQLNALGATLAIAVPPDNEIKFVKNLLHRPVKWEKEDLARLMRNHIHWIDDKPLSVEQLATGLGLNFVPDRIGAFFPKELEELLLKKELAYQHKREEQIRETRFQVIMRGLRQYDIVVIHQVLW